jgi:hypothetical protein
MSDFVFNRGDLNTVMLTVLSLSNTIPDISRYSVPTVEITHVNGGGEIIDLAPIAMTQLGSSNRWYHKYTIPLLASYTKYLTTFKTVFDGIDTVTTEEFRVIPVNTCSGTGEFEIVLVVENSATMQPIPDATISVYDKNNPSVIIASGQTASDGKATFFLSAGIYLVEFRKTGVISEVHTMTVDSLGHYTLDGD